MRLPLDHLRAGAGRIALASNLFLGAALAGAAPGDATIGFDPADGGHWSLDQPGVALVAPAPLFRVVADGAIVEHLAAPVAERSADGRTLRVSGQAEGLPALAIVAERARLADADGWDCRLTLRNTGAVPIAITAADAFAGRLAGDWRALSFTSKWGEEWEPEEFPVAGARELEVRTGRSSLGRHPWLGLTRATGGAVAIAPVWSGNWHIAIVPANAGMAALTAGISPWKFSHVLAPGEAFTAPSVLIAVATNLDEASVALTRSVAATLPRSTASDALPVEWNSWWPYEDQDINEAVFLANVDVAAQLGIEVATLDAGWFGASDAGSAWWDVRGDFSDENRARFPHGISWLADETRRRGLKFGIWMEVEAVGLKSRLRHEHPELLARRDEDPPADPLDAADPGFLGYICLGSPAGRAHVRHSLDELVARTHCAWIKIDFNLDPKAGCNRAGHGHGTGDGLYAHYQGLYAVLDAFRAAHPEVIVEACASGGLRVDAGLLRHVHGAFLSDPDWTRHHLQVVHGTSRLLPPAAMLHWAMSEFRWKHPRQTLDLRDPALTTDAFDALVRAAFLHRFGVSWRLPDLPARWRERAAQHIALYQNTVRPFVRDGDLRRLTDSPRREGGGETQPAFQLSRGDRHLLLGFALEPSPGGLVIRPTALRPNARYRLVRLDFAVTGEAETRTGADWMQAGLPAVPASSFLGILEPAPAE